MKHVAAYLLAQLGGKASPSEAVRCCLRLHRACVPAVQTVLLA